MLIPESQVRIWLCGEPTDMRKSFYGLAGLVRSKLGEDPLSGQLFVFINRRATQMKVLYLDQGGYRVWAKRLEQWAVPPRSGLGGYAPGDGPLLDGGEEAMEFLFGAALAQVEHQRDESVRREVASAGESFLGATEVLDKIAASRRVVYAFIDGFKISEILCTLTG